METQFSLFFVGSYWEGRASSGKSGTQADYIAMSLGEEKMERGRSIATRATFVRFVEPVESRHQCSRHLNSQSRRAVFLVVLVWWFAVLLNTQKKKFVDCDLRLF